MTVRSLLLQLDDEFLSAWSSEVTYGNVRLCRCLVAFFGLRFADTADDWEVWSRMSRDVRKKCERMGLLAYENAILYRDGLRDLLQDSTYSFADLICYLCLCP